MSAPSLRSRIRNGTLAMLVIALGLGAAALPTVYRLGGAIRETLHRNYLSIEAAQHMHSALYTVQLAQRDGAAAGVLPRSRALFAHWIDVELHDITEVGEDRLAADIERRGRELFDALAADPNAGRDADFAVLNSRLDDLIAINQAAMFRADSRASRLGDRVTYEFAAALGLLLLIGAALSLTLAWAIARPLDELAERLRALGARAGHPRVGTQNLAELDAVAQEFNKMAERLEEFDRLNVGRLLYEKDKTEAIVESLDDGIVLLDPGGIVAHINETAALIVAVDRAGALGSSFDDLDSNHPHYLKVRAALRGGGASLAESPIEIALEVRGREHFYMLKALPLRKSTGESFGTLVTLQDVTYLRDKDRARAALLARLVRELETPLRSLARAADLLQQRDGRLDAQQRGLVETLREDVADLSRKLGELLKGA